MLEEKADIAYRWSCDRIFCASAPAPWTGKPNLPDKLTKKANSGEKLDDGYKSVVSYLNDIQTNPEFSCNDDATSEGEMMRKIADCKILGEGKTIEYKDEKGNKVTKSVTDSTPCYLYDGAYWIKDDKSPNTGNKYHMIKIADVNDNVASDKADRYRYARGNPPSENLFTARPGKCQDNCETMGYKKGEGSDVMTKSKFLSYMDNEHTKYYGEPYGITYGDEKTGDEFDIHLNSLTEVLEIPTPSCDSSLFSNNHQQCVDDSSYINQNLKLKTGVKKCYCVQEGGPVSNEEKITPYYNENVRSNQKGYEFVKGGGENDDSEKWNYRYAQTGYIYPASFDERFQDTTIGEDLISKDFEAKKEYDSRLYFTGRDQSANLGIDTVWYGTKIPETDPNTQHITAVQNVCLTGIYNRLNLVKNILASIGTCIESAKYTGDYSSEVCKELFSQYVCTAANDVILAIISDCSPIGRKQSDISEAGILSVAGAGLGGLYEGVGSSVNDFNGRYDNAAMKSLLGEGAGGVAHKVCMGALGYDWDLDFQGVMDAAYESEFQTNVMAPTLRRTHLFINPTTGLPVYEYRGGIYVTPGCDIDSYSASLVCVTDADRNKKGVNCKKPEECPCLNAPRQIYNTKIQGGRMTQGVPEDRAFHDVLDNSAFVYDHLKVELNMEEDKKKRCLSESHSDGVFYFPIAGQNTSHNTWM